MNVRIGRNASLASAVVAFGAVAILVSAGASGASECDDARPEWLACEDFEEGDLGWVEWFRQSPFVQCNGCPDSVNDPARIRLVEDPDSAHRGDWALHFPAEASAGFTGGSLTYRHCAGEKRAGCRPLVGHEQLYFRTWVRLAEDHEYVHHFLSVAGTRPNAYWESDGNAGCRPNGTRWAGTTLDFNRERELFFYTYFPEMRCDRGNYCSGDYARQICEGCAAKDMPCVNGPECCWGNHFKPEEPVVLPRGEWVCLELGMRLNTPGEADGEMWFWVNDEPALAQGDMRWRDVADLQLNKAWLQHYIAGGDADRPNRAWFDDVVVSTERIGCGLTAETPTTAPRPTDLPTAPPPTGTPPATDAPARWWLYMPELIGD